MNLLFHHVRKDLRHSCWSIALTWLAAAGIFWLPAAQVEKRAEVMQWLPFFRYGSWVLLFLTVARIVQLDAPLRDTAFLRSRPVSSGTWLVSKLASGVVILLPIALFQVVALPLAGLRLDFTDSLLLFFEEALVLSVVAALALALSTRMETYPRFIGLTLGIAFAGFIVLVSYLVFDRWLTRGIKPEWGYDIEYLKLSRLLITQFIAVAGLVAGCRVCLRARHRERLGLVISGTALIAALAWFYWPMNFVKTFTRAEAEAPSAEWPDLSRLKFSFEERKQWSREKAGPVPARFTFGDGGYNGTIYRDINGHTRLDGLPDEWFAYPNSIDAQLVFSNGKTLASRYTAWAGLSETMALPLVGIPLPWDKASNPLSGVALAKFPVPEAANAMTGAKLKGEIHIPIKRPVILARLPLRDGVSARVGNRRIWITDVERLDKKIHYKLAIETPRIGLRGGWYSEPHRRIEFLAVNVGKREYLTQGSNSGFGDSSAHYALEGHDISQTIWHDPKKKWDGGLIPGDWLDGAELLVVGDEYGGTLSQSFSFSDVTLSNP